jgi:hypothetical protein
MAVATMAGVKTFSLDGASTTRSPETCDRFET